MQPIQKQKNLIESLKKCIQDKERKLTRFRNSFAESLKEKQIAMFGGFNKTQSLFNDHSDQVKKIRTLEREQAEAKNQLKKEMEKLSFLIDTENSPALF